MLAHRHRIDRADARTEAAEHAAPELQRVLDQIPLFVALGRAKAARKGVDLLVVNRVGWSEGFATDRNAVIVLSGDGDIVGEADGSKAVVADRILDLISKDVHA